ncbi:hypothetical protein TraAM80_01634 [Trypanosoma rangeli]|uniref:Uncharacterized protein n=1 Tax=Trypanosoma rangeli TaxID=5698 RepID=A0A422NXY5_TRYRA|nr:uncharacterized protein TraAM80_01634 [Trypanosoma rangeli]RNF10291.1 hypothetical protein TraAM80_01634 [Trypanosoma rangeli]|eukprot:RNF10291.1 hypothetical protein TraAM80_01634 [Trypanosoma rangeli]
MGANRGLAEMPRQMRQLLRRIPVGHSSIYLNELQPSNQHFFLKACMTSGPHTSHGSVKNVLGVSIDRGEISCHASLQALTAKTTEAKQQEGKASPMYIHAHVSQHGVYVAAAARVEWEVGGVPNPSSHITDEAASFFTVRSKLDA